MKVFLFLLLSMVFQMNAFSQMPDFTDPQTGQKIPTGKLVGKIFTQDANQNKTYLKNQPVAIIAYYQGQRVLMLDKKSDESGNFEFKNIFKDSNYAYALGAMVDNKVYVMKDLFLKKDEEKISVDFWVGEGSPHLMEMSEQIPSQPRDNFANEKAEPNVKTFMGSTHQKTTVFLSALVLIMAAIFYFRKK